MLSGPLKPWSVDTQSVGLAPTVLASGSRPLEVGSGDLLAAIPDFSRGAA